MAPDSSNRLLQSRGLSDYSFSLKFLLFVQLSLHSYTHSDTTTPKKQLRETYIGALHAGKFIPPSKIQ